MVADPDGFGTYRPRPSVIDPVPVLLMVAHMAVPVTTVPPALALAKPAAPCIPTASLIVPALLAAAFAAYWPPSAKESVFPAAKLTDEASLKPNIPPLKFASNASGVINLSLRPRTVAELSPDGLNVYTSFTAVTLPPDKSVLVNPMLTLFKSESAASGPILRLVDTPVEVANATVPVTCKFPRYAVPDAYRSRHDVVAVPMSCALFVAGTMSPVVSSVPDTLNVSLGVLVPMPNRLLVSSQNKLLPSSLTLVSEPKNRTEPAVPPPRAVNWWPGFGAEPTATTIVVSIIIARSATMFATVAIRGALGRRSLCLSG